MSPMGEAVPRLPPIVARLRMSGDANCGNSSASSGTRPARRCCDLRERQGRADLDARRRRTSSVRSSGSRSIAIVSGARRPRRFTSTPQSVVPATTTASGSSRSSPQRLVERGGAHEPLVAVVEPGGDGARGRVGRAARRADRRLRARRARRRRRGSAGSRCTGRGCRSARAGRSRWGRGARRRARRRCPRRPRASGSPAAAVVPVELAGHAAREARACSSRTASRPPRRGRACTGCGCLGVPRPSAVTSSCPSSAAAGHEARVHRRPLGAAVVVGRREQHGARPALALGAPLLAPGQPDAAQPVERGRVRATRRAAGVAAR